MGRVSKKIQKLEAEDSTVEDRTKLLLALHKLPQRKQLEAFFYFPSQGNATVGNVCGLGIHQELLGTGSEVNSMEFGITCFIFIDSLYTSRILRVEVKFAQ